MAAAWAVMALAGRAPGSQGFTTTVQPRFWGSSALQAAAHVSALALSPKRLPPAKYQRPSPRLVQYANAFTNLTIGQASDGHSHSAGQSQSLPRANPGPSCQGSSSTLHRDPGQRSCAHSKKLTLSSSGVVRCSWLSTSHGFSRSCSVRVKLYSGTEQMFA